MRALRKFAMTAFFAAAATCSLHGGNMLCNSSFELGPKGYDCVCGIRANGETVDFTSGGFELDSQGAFHGSKSLKLSISASQFARLVSHEFKLSPGHQYTFSFWAKSDADKYPVCVSVVSQARDGENVKRAWKGSPAFQLGREWTRFSFSFSAGEAPCEWYFLMLEPKNDTKSWWRPGAFWLDAIQLEEGGLTGYAPASPVELAIYAPQEISDGEELKGHVSAISYASLRQGANATLSLFENLREKLEAESHFSFDLKPGVAEEHGFRFDGLKFGGHSLSVEMDGRRVEPADSYFIKLRKLPSSGGQGFLPGCNGTLLGSSLGTEIKQDTDGTPSSIAKDAGFSSRILRSFEGGWGEVEPQKGVYDWRKYDLVVDVLKRNHVEPFMILGPDFTVYDGKNTLPEWVKARDRNGSPSGTLLKGSTYGHKCILPQLEDWRSYVRAVVERYKGRVRHYEVLNEPNCSLSPEAYVEYLKAAYEEAKVADTDVRIVGICSTEDMGGRAIEYIDKCLALGAGSFLDAVSFHPYASRMDDSQITAMSRIRAIKDVLRKAGVGKPLWNTECFYLNSKSQGNGVLESRIPLGAVSRRLAIDMGEGLAASTPLNFPEQCYRNADRSHALWIWRERRQPSEILVEQNMASFFLAGAEQARPVELQGGVMCYIFKSGSSVRSAIWSVDEKATAEIAPPPGVSAACFDVFGNAMAESGESLAVDLDRLPKYLEWKSAGRETEEDAVAAAIKSAKIRFKNEFRIGRAGIALEAGKAYVLASVKNCSGQRLENVQAFVEAKGLPEAQAVSIAALEPLEMADIRFPLPANCKFDPENEVDACFRFSRAGSEFKISKTIFITNSVKAEKRTFSQWFEIKKAIDGKPDSEADLSAKFCLGYEGSDLLVKVKVKDDVRGAPSKDPWMEDDVELFIDAFPRAHDKMKDGWSYGKGCIQLHMNPHRKAGSRTAGPLKMSESVNELPDGYEAELRVPLKDFLGASLDGKSIGFDIAIDDSDSNKRKTQMVWNGKRANSQDCSGFGLIYFKP